MKISIGCDHGGLELKNAIVAHLKQSGHAVIDHGAHDTISVDYPDYAQLVGNSVVSHQADLGILICTTGIGVCIAANKIKGIRAGEAFNEDSARYMRLHNDANVMCMGQKYVTPYLANKYVDVFINTQFEGGRHAKRTEKIKVLEG